MTEHNRYLKYSLKEQDNSLIFPLDLIYDDLIYL
jgi:hypothetical protein